MCAQRQLNKTATGFPEDSTRLPEYYDDTYKYLKSIGIEELQTDAAHEHVTTDVYRKYNVEN